MCDLPAPVSLYTHLSVPDEACFSSLLLSPSLALSLGVDSGSYRILLYLVHSVALARIGEPQLVLGSSVTPTLHPLYPFLPPRQHKIDSDVRMLLMVSIMAGHSIMFSAVCHSVLYSPEGQ